MRTEDLIRSLGEELRPVPRGAVGRRIAIGMAGGAIVTLALVLCCLGMRPDMMSAMAGSPFWMKWGYTILLDLVAIAAVLHLARPQAARPRWLWLMWVPVVVLALLTGRELLIMPMDGWHHLWTGHSWRICSMLVAMLSLPILAGLLWSFRKLAPTRLRLTGAVAGLAAGACGATLYGLHCQESSALFILTWYSLGIAMVVALGTLVGPRLLRW
jgi:hypothetical protein